LDTVQLTVRRQVWHTCVMQEDYHNLCDEELQDGIGVEALIYLRRRVIHDQTAVLLSFLSCGVVLAWPMDAHHGRCLGKFLVVSSETESFGAAAVSDDNEFLVTADSNGYVKACFNPLIATLNRRATGHHIAIQ